MSLASNTRLIVCHVFFQGLGSAMIVTSGYYALLVADRMVYYVSCQCTSWTRKLGLDLNKGSSDRAPEVAVN